ncbi:PucR family transcriptional regulator [Geodermatophilus marinus]|uniref:PucR family transcriptional regulator n=1 Tax=Geodermatophilus sp. LHW52908 TaxID=2303986 RepID=UPI000E3D60FD|nr:helix-turn-helix domain-containing protein [Geodermatophilus sp. LHW52908]RFU22540.1 PucR family transcriptional regulator [Geodermatophilus sp. LHW52908]
MDPLTADTTGAVTARVAEAAARERALPPGLLEGYLGALVAVARTGGRLSAEDEDACRRAGGEAAATGVGLPVLVDLYMSASRRLWPWLPELVAAGRGRPVRTAELVALGEAVWQAADTALAALAEGHGEAQRQVVRREEAFRREFVEDLLGGGSDVGSLVERAEHFGLSLAGTHLVLLAATDRAADSGMPVAALLEDDLRARAAHRGTLFAVKEGRLAVVVAVPPAAGPAAHAAAAEELAARAGPAVARLTRQVTWRAGVGRAHPGPQGVARSYLEALEALDVAARLDLPQRVTHARDLLVYRVLLRDEEAIADLVGTVLGPLTAARGGPVPLLRTLETWFAAGRNSAETARRLHLSVRAVTYRLERVRELTGHRPGDPAADLPLQVAVTGARLLDWPRTPLPGT